mmetsp:Transcript_25936/g.36723  ORF Transcript_25936/g.36723 Transcript_25936/m.36723 type:complete len:214 (+) Transcript_25936:176-817(+)
MVHPSLSTPLPKQNFACGCSDNFNGFATSFWGPCLWYVLGHFCLRSKESGTDEEFDRMITTCGSVMPCLFCRQHFQNIFHDCSGLTSRTNRITALTKLHNIVTLHVENRTFRSVSAHEFVSFYGNEATAVFAAKFFLGCLIKNRTSFPETEQDSYCQKVQTIERFFQSASGFASEFTNSREFVSPDLEVFRAKRDLSHCLVSVLRTPCFAKKT